MTELVIRGGTIITMDPDWRVLHGDIACQDGTIVQIGGTYTPTSDNYQILNAEECLVLPGFVQSHVHTCQTLARGHAENLELLEWLRTVIWPYEAQLTRQDVHAAAQLACAELLCGGTTTILDMATVHHTDAVFEVASQCGIRASIGKAMMDETDSMTPVALRETTQESLDESLRLLRQWHGADKGRLQYAFAPRFTLSCTDSLLESVAAIARQENIIIHTHANENKQEIAAIQHLKGTDNILHLHKLGVSGRNVSMAHCVWLTDQEQEVLRNSNTNVLHCPSSNLKLASGVADIPTLLANNINVGLGADGAPCNNNLDAFLEMRLASLLQKPKFGAQAMPATTALYMATMGGAKALGLEQQIGSLEIGKRADAIIVDLQTLHTQPSTSPYATLVYAARTNNVRHVVVDGNVLVRDHTLLTLDKEAVIAVAREHSQRLFPA